MIEILDNIVFNKRLVNISILLIGLSISVYTLYLFKNFMMPFAAALMLTFLLAPLTRYDGKKKTYVIMVSAVVMISFVIAALIFGNYLTQEVSKIKLNNQDFSSMIWEKEIDLGIKTFKVREILENEEVLGQAKGIVTATLNAVGKLFSDFLVVLVFLAFILPSYHSYIHRLSCNIKKKKRKQFIDAILKIERNVRMYLLVKSGVSLLTAILCGAVMWYFNVKFVLVFMILVFLLNFIPNIGSIAAVAIILFVHILSTGPTYSFMMLAIMLSLIQFIVGNFLDPKLAGDKVEMSPLTVLASLFFWGTIWGIIGMFMAVPLTVIAKIAVESVYGQR